MKAKDLNISSEKTKRKIRTAFLQLLYEKKELKKITIMELSKRADIDRSTFYLHYSDLYSIAEDMEVEIIEEISSQREIKSTDDIILYFDEICRALKKHSDEYSMLLASDEPLIFLRKLRKLVIERICLYIPNKENEDEWKVGISVFVNGMAEKFVEFYRGKINIEFDRLCEILRNILIKVICNIY